MTVPLPATALVLAGGGSMRFGSDKLAYPVAGQPLARYALDAVGLVCREALVLTGPDDGEPSREWLTSGRRGWRVLHDREPKPGPLVAVGQGLASAGYARCIVIGADMPLLAPPLLERMLVALADRRSGAPLGIALRLDGEVQPLPVALRRVAVTAVTELIAEGRRSLRDLLRALPLRILDEEEWRAYDHEAATFLDVDDVRDLSRLRRMLASARS